MINLFKVKQQILAMALFHKPGKLNSATSSSSKPGALEMPLFSQHNDSKPVHFWKLHQANQI